MGRPTRGPAADRVPGLGWVPHRSPQHCPGLGPPGTGRTHLATGLGIAAANDGHRVQFATATGGSPGSPTPTVPEGSPTSSSSWSAAATNTPR
ncbi:ATP-binding protein [Skermania piniformis]|uniref:ATP-binding protein n=1 Tax=Skermania pinensis TaxID=39122 RepID=UPI002484B1FF|nr:ATP-binding protein [Skermania piniformis]